MLARIFKGVNWVKRYPVDSLQIYFAGSLEIQEELIRHGLKVPRDHSGTVKMPIPIIYSNFRGWIGSAEPITIERLIPPEWLGLTFEDLKWKRTVRNGREAYELPEEKVYVDIGIPEGEADTLIFNLHIEGYHLERTSIRSVNPEKWSNWAMFYIDLGYIDDLINLLEKYAPKVSPSIALRKEVQQGGKEVTYYYKVPIKDFSLCMGCFDLVQRYLYIKVKEHCKVNALSNSDICRDPNKIISKLKLRLVYDPCINIYAKVGIAKISGKRPQIMIKIASEGPVKEISGILKPKIRGKVRGRLVYCDHRVRVQYVALSLKEFYRVLLCVKEGEYVDRLPRG